MKFRVTMKDPDTLHDAISEAIAAEIAKNETLDDDEKESIAESRREKLNEMCGQWFKYSEYLTVEIDTTAKTCVVVKAG